MNIIIVTDVFPPLRSSGAIQLRDLSREFVKQGHTITVAVATPSLKESYHISNWAGVEILRLRTWPKRGDGYVSRTIAEFFMPYCMLLGFKKSPITSRHFDALIWYSPTIFLGPFVKWLKQHFGCIAYLIIRDIFPEWAWEIGLIRSKLVYGAFKAVANYQYAQANVIGVQSSGNYAYFDLWHKRHQNIQIEVLQNWLSPTPGVASSITIEDSKLKGRKVFVYAGNIGVAQNTKVFLDLAKQLKNYPDIGFLFVGRGTEFALLAAEYGGLDNVLFHDEIDPAEMSGLYAQCKAGLVALDHRHKTHNIPGKFLSYMQAGLPVLCSVNPDNDLVKLIESYRVGVVPDANTPDRLMLAAFNLLELMENSSDIAERCRLLSLQMFSSSSAVSQIVDALNKFNLSLPKSQ